MKTYRISQHPCQEHRLTSELSFQDQHPRGCSRAGPVRRAGPLHRHPSELPLGRKPRLAVTASPKPEAVLSPRWGEVALPSPDAHSQVEASYSTPLTGGTKAHTPAMLEAKKECSGFH